MESDLKRLFDRLREIVIKRGLDPEYLDYKLFEFFIRKNSYVLENRNRIVR